MKIEDKVRLTDEINGDLSVEEVGELRYLYHATIVDYFETPVKIAFIDHVGREKITTSDGSWWNLDGSQRRKRGKLRWSVGHTLRPYLNEHREQILRQQVLDLLDVLARKIQFGEFNCEVLQEIQTNIEVVLLVETEGD